MRLDTSCPHMQLQHSAVISTFDIFISLYVMLSFLCVQAFLIYQHEFCIYDLILASLLLKYILQHLVFLHNLQDLQQYDQGNRWIETLLYVFTTEYSILFICLMNTTFCKVVVYNDYWWNSCLLTVLQQFETFQLLPKLSFVQDQVIQLVHLEILHFYKAITYLFNPPTIS